MENTRPPSLDWLVLVKIACYLWKQDDVVSAASKFHLPPAWHRVKQVKSAWQEVESIVVAKVHVLPLPAILKKKILMFVNAVGWQILMWMLHVRQTTNRCTWSVDDIKKICFTPMGVVEKTKTTEAFIDNSCFEIHERYKLACVYCIEKHIDALRREATLYKRVRGIKEQDLPLVTYWTSYSIRKACARYINETYTDDDDDDDDDDDQYEYDDLGDASCHLISMFRSSISYGIEEAGKFFWDKLYQREELNHEQKRNILLQGAEYTICTLSLSCLMLSFQEYLYNMLSFIFFEMNEEEQNYILSKVPRSILTCFLYWPRQSLFKDVLHRTRDILSQHDYMYLLKEISDRMLQGYEDFDYKLLFRELWDIAPSDHKKFVACHCDSEHLLQKLSDVNDREIISLILREATPEEQLKIFSSDIGKVVRNKLNDQGDGDFIQFFSDMCKETHPPTDM